MDGLIKFAAIMVLLYMFGWLGKKNSRMVENWIDNISRLFNKKRRNNTEPQDIQVNGEKSKLQKAFNDPKELERFMKSYNLSSREWEIIELVCNGFTNNEIEDKIFLSLATVKDYLHKIFRKTGVKNRVQLVNFIRNSIDEANNYSC
jgi:DNA-binding NarL/FixJ family response regulator